MPTRRSSTASKGFPEMASAEADDTPVPAAESKAEGDANLDESVDNRNVMRDLAEDAIGEGEETPSASESSAAEPKGTASTSQPVPIPAHPKPDKSLQTPEQRYFEDGAKQSPKHHAPLPQSHFKDVFLCHVFQLDDANATHDAMVALGHAFGSTLSG